ncbi:hypothetical protein [Spirosoma validum]|uniref:Uncharacterized protein n=1 Tax=Spirosoma validum TaxID=2771355 RepID=A0A927B1L7_9BACT|nr:hypothetical protein [Spirosoma validum]MBD2753748.1 hypothetical protein [Spirosoma validum]
MHYYLRLHCYNDSSRQSFTQLGPDESVEGPVHFEYGELVRVGEEKDDPATWLLYYVAHRTGMKQIADPAREGKKALLFEVYLARKEQWAEFEMPQELRDVMDSDSF